MINFPLLLLEKRANGVIFPLEGSSPNYNNEHVCPVLEYMRLGAGWAGVWSDQPTTLSSFSPLNILVLSDCPVKSNLRPTLPFPTPLFEQLPLLPFPLPLYSPHENFSLLFFPPFTSPLNPLLSPPSSSSKPLPTLHMTPFHNAIDVYAYIHTYMFTLFLLPSPGPFSL